MEPFFIKFSHIIHHPARPIKCKAFRSTTTCERLVKNSDIHRGRHFCSSDKSFYQTELGHINAGKNWQSRSRYHIVERGTLLGRRKYLNLTHVSVSAILMILKTQDTSELRKHETSRRCTFAVKPGLHEPQLQVLSRASGFFILL